MAELASPPFSKFPEFPSSLNFQNSLVFVFVYRIFHLNHRDR